MVLARVITRLGAIEPVTPRHVEGLFAVDLAYLQDFYGVINFGSDADIEALLEESRAAQIPESAADSDADEFTTGGNGNGDYESAGGGRRGRAAIEEVPSVER
jgi:hypothetical protein